MEGLVQVHFGAQVLPNQEIPAAAQDGPGWMEARPQHIERGNDLSPHDFVKSQSWECHQIEGLHLEV